MHSYIQAVAAMQLLTSTSGAIWGSVSCHKNTSTVESNQWTSDNKMLALPLSNSHPWTHTKEPSTWPRLISAHTNISLYSILIFFLFSVSLTIEILLSQWELTTAVMAEWTKHLLRQAFSPFKSCICSHISNVEWWLRAWSVSSAIVSVTCDGSVGHVWVIWCEGQWVSEAQCVMLKIVDMVKSRGNRTEDSNKELWLYYVI